MTGTKTLLSCLSLVVALSSLAQSTQDIREAQQRIDRMLPQLQAHSLDMEGESAEGGEAMAYFEQDSIRKLSTTYFGERGKRYTAYYFLEGVPSLVERTEYRYNRPIYYDQKMAAEYGDTAHYDPKKTQTEVTTYYIRNDSIIIWLDHEGNPASLAGKDTDKVAQTLLKEAKELLGRFKEPDLEKKE
ncbi:hypothetical protein [Maribacter sp. 2307ULW6-5]|uniref:hypothetical protein n=1 Tax=Maribacter sp. 2307ULW6-5 TaxID=3386275 RepID=UPI0039BC24C1